MSLRSQSLSPAERLIVAENISNYMVYYPRLAHFPQPARDLLVAQFGLLFVQAIEMNRRNFFALLLNVATEIINRPFTHIPVVVLNRGAVRKTPADYTDAQAHSKFRSLSAQIEEIAASCKASIG